MSDHLVKRGWLEIALQIHHYHISRIKDNEHWRLEDTARELRRSVGSICHYVEIGSWFKTHENVLRRCESMRDAIAAIKKAKRTQQLSELS